MIEKKSLVLLMSLCTVACSAYADPLSVKVENATVTLYGTLDAGIWVQNKATGNGTPPGPTNLGSDNQFHSGGIAPSKWGLRGERKMDANGTKGFFVLEEHITGGTGATDAFGYPGFARQAFVGLSGSFGTVQLGEQFSPALLAFAATDPRGLREALSGLQPWIMTSNFSNSTSSTTLDSFTHNAISYAIDLSQFHLAAHYGLGGQVGATGASSNWSLGATYSGKPVTVSTAYQVANGTNGNKGSVKESIGAAIANGAYTYKANYLNATQFDLLGIQTGKYKIAGVGVEWKPVDKHTVGLSYYSGKNDIIANNKAGSLIVSEEYAFAPNTTLYAQVALIDAKSTADAGVSVLGMGNLVQGTKTSVFNTGVSFSF